MTCTHDTGCCPRCCTCVRLVARCTTCGRKHCNEHEAKVEVRGD